MQKNLKYLIIFLFFLGIFHCKVQEQKPRNIILMIGDGMGPQQILMGMYSSQQPLHFMKFKDIGLKTTHSADNLVTDSASAATAMATGEKTYNKAISVDINKKSLKTIMELAKEKGYSIGVVVTSSLTNATPAAFLAHSESRENEYEIAEDIIQIEPDIALGGGLKFFQNRMDGKDLIKALESKNYQIFYDWKEINTNNLDINRKAIGLFASTGMPPVVSTKVNQNSKYAPYLAENADINNVRSKEFLPLMTQFAIEYLNKKGKPFILMVEGSQIDFAGHNMDAPYLTEEVLDFDKAIGVAYEFVERSKNTLLVITADHETGGFAITGGKIESGKLIVPETKYLYEKHTSTLIPVFAYGVGSEEFRGIYDNTDIFKKIIKLWF